MNRTARKQRLARAKRRAHHLWKGAEEDGRPVIKRARPEEEFEMSMEAGRGKRGRRTAGRNEVSDLNAVYWGLFGASLVDSKTLSSDIPRSVANQFNRTARRNAGNLPRVLGWSKLGTAFATADIAGIRKDISFGMQTRLASKYFNVPFLAAADIVYDMEGVDHRQVKQAIDMIREGRRREAVNRYGDLAMELSRIYTKYKDAKNRKLAIDRSAKEYWESYLGPFGQEMVREIKKRVRADLAKAWMRKHGVDDAAAEYWASYYGEYGEKWVSVVPKMISPKSDD